MSLRELGTESGFESTALQLLSSELDPSILQPLEITIPNGSSLKTQRQTIWPACLQQFKVMT